MTISWILAAVLILAVAAALYAAYYALHQRSRAEAAEQALRSHEDELEQFTASTMPYVADAVRRSDVSVEIPISGGQGRVAQLLRALGDRYVGDLRLLQAEARDRARREAEYEAQQAVSRAETKTRTDAENTSREATSAAVRAFGTSVVSLGADVSQVVSTALREHRGDDVYETLTRIDHSVQQMIRQSQSYVIVCGGLPGRRWPQQSLTDVIGGAVGRVRDFTRVRPHQLDRSVISRAVEPLVHTLATLLDNALRYSPPTSFVDVTFQEGHHGVTVIVDDAGVRMNAEQMEEARQVLAGERVVDIHQLGPAPRVGFPGIAALARRYGFTVYIDGPNTYGGMRAMVYIPEALLAPRESNPQRESTPQVATPAVISAAPEPVEEPASARHAFGREPVETGQHAGAPSGAHAAMTGGPQGAITGEVRPVQTGTSRPPADDAWSVTAVNTRPATTTGTHAAPAEAPRAAAPEPADDDESLSTVHEITPGGLPRRRRRTVAVSTLSRGPDTDTALPRPDIAAAWQNGTQTGRTSAAHENTEGMTS
ncbi:signal transduction histidine kinase [Nocardia transvalensis]|uniref:histidine kinase n=1 Tax=Nocardia transvalensis TaxID=37333 RepID=A0A7W9P950_9NOCA|nr:sensor histidine kinase [Nocardia transvalensis]MBB5911797.1 signal transduction histidine kinase [Nocardia transvalensis]